jgi:hypothetical protein
MGAMRSRFSFAIFLKFLRRDLRQLSPLSVDLSPQKNLCLTRPDRALSTRL